MDTPSETSREVARVLSARLRGAGISQREAAERTGIPLTTLSRRLTGHAPFLVTELAALAELVGADVSAIVLAAEDSTSRQVVA